MIDHLDKTANRLGDLPDSFGMYRKLAAVVVEFDAPRGYAKVTAKSVYELGEATSTAPWICPTAQDGARPAK